MRHSPQLPGRSVRLADHVDLLKIVDEAFENIGLAEMLRLGLVAGGLGEAGEALDGNGVAIDREPCKCRLPSGSRAVRAKPSLAGVDGRGVSAPVMQSAVPFTGFFPRRRQVS